MSRRALVLFALMSVIWGIPYLFIRVAVAEMSPAVLVLERTTIGAAILLPIALVRVDLRAVLTHWRWIVAFAAVEMAIPWYFLASAEQHISSSLAALLIAGVPLVGAVIALTNGDRISNRDGAWRRTDDPVIRAFRSSGGKDGGRANPVILLTTTGRRVGQPLVTPLNFSRDGDPFVVIGSVGGSRLPGK